MEQPFFFSSSVEQKKEELLLHILVLAFQKTMYVYVKDEMVFTDLHTNLSIH